MLEISRISGRSSARLPSSSHCSTSRIRFGKTLVHKIVEGTMRIDNFFDELVFTSDREGIKMRVSKIICFAIGAMLAATAIYADETVIVSNILGPEGPL